MKLFERKTWFLRSGEDQVNADNVIPRPPPRMKWKLPTPEMDASIFNGMLFLWLQPLFNRAAFLNRRGMALEMQDLVPLPSIDSSQAVEAIFTSAYNKYESTTQRKTTPDADADANAKRDLEARLIHSLLAVCKQRLISAGIIKFFNTTLQFTFPVMMNAILKFFEEYQSGVIPDDAPASVRYRGYWLSVLLVFFIVCKAITESAYFHKVNRCAWQVKTAVSTSIYSKSLRLASSEQKKTTSGEMVNFMQIDATKLEAFVPQIHVLWDGIFQITGYMLILGLLLGWPCIVGLILMCFAGPVMGSIMGKLLGINHTMVKFTDERVKTVNEAIQGIRCVKMYTWEASFHKVVSQSREQELESLRRIASLRGFSRAYMLALPTLAAVVTFIAYGYGTNRPILASTLFSALVAFDQLSFPLMYYPTAIAQYAQAKISLGRVAIFLGYKELTGEGYIRHENGTGEIVIENATVYWSDPNIPVTIAELDDTSLDKSEYAKSKMLIDEIIYPKSVVSGISLRVAPGELCAVIGRVGSGKSSLCAAILNETVLSQDSHIKLSGKVAYVAQSAWILNTSVRENILFGLPYDEERYLRVLSVCQLTHDLEMLDAGDMTEIGEKGINLSGGQKQRVSVARAAYSNSDVVIFDDPLSALDPEVAQKMFDECIVSFLSKKTRLLVTNQLQCLSKCDSIVALGKGGKVVEKGTFHDLIQNEKGEVKRLLKDLEETAKTNAEAGDQMPASGPKKLHVKQLETPSPEVFKDHSSGETKTLVTQEEREVGAVKRQVYFKYIIAGGGWLRFTIVLFAFILSTGISLVRDLWISLWTSDTNFQRHGQGFYLGGYAGFAILVGIFTFFQYYLLATFGVRASKDMHANLLSSILRAPMSFFDTTPTGRILSRFSKDMHTIDQELSEFIDFVLFMTLGILATVATIAFVTPWFTLTLLPLGFFYWKILNYFRDVSRETKRLESLARSPVYSHFSETLSGLSTIRAYGKSNAFIRKFETKLDGSIQTVYCNKSGERWLATRLDMVGACIVGFAATFATQVVVANGATGVGANTSYSSLAGLSLKYAIQITGVLQWVVRSFAQVEAAMNATERVIYYSEQIEREAAMESDELAKDAAFDPSMNVATKAVVASGKGVAHPAVAWPERGAITMKNLRMRYRSATPLVLRGLDISIAGGERIGVVGRTGSGKSSLLLCLMRIVEPELNATPYEAPLTIDGIDILRIGLKALRSAVGIIPQNPVLFSGTIRSNMDPFDDYSEEQIWSALDKCGMKSAVVTMPGGLMALVAEYGENLSQGQRQLLCLGRSLLKQCRILLLDEATSSVDFETDREIQRTIREAFRGSTVLTIAHRVNTILDSDKILVMKDGVAAEFASPTELLEDENSLFSDMVRHSQAESEESTFA